MNKLSINAQPRTEIGRKVKLLRKKGNIPATVYGKSLKSLSITVNAEDFEKVYTESGETGLIELSVDSKNHPVLVNNVQKHPVTNEILHIEFHEVNLKEKVKTKVPVVLVGVALAVSQKTGVVLQLISEIEVEALPADLPEKIEVDISHLVKVHDEIHVGQIKIPNNVQILSEKDVAIASISALVSHEAEADTKVQEAAAQAQSEQAAGEAGSTSETSAPTAEVKTNEDKK